ncbi:hypothetical protein [Amnibacterium kyonggiense]
MIHFPSGGCAMYEGALLKKSTWPAANASSVEVKPLGKPGSFGPGQLPSYPRWISDQASFT